MTHDRPTVGFINEVKKLVDSVSGFLRNDDGNDDYYIACMCGDVFAVLEKAREIPELQAWAVRQLQESNGGGAS
jgi:hypothetical protein